jgi:hypothetical protein
MLHFPARTIQTQSAPENAGTKYLVNIRAKVVLQIVLSKSRYPRFIARAGGVHFCPLVLFNSIHDPFL